MLCASVREGRSLALLAQSVDGQLNVPLSLAVSLLITVGRYERASAQQPEFQWRESSHGGGGSLSSSRRARGGSSGGAGAIASAAVAALRASRRGAGGAGGYSSRHSLRSLVSRARRSRSRAASSRGGGHSAAGDAGEESPGERLWSVVRAVVRVDFSHPDVLLAFRDAQQRGGGGGASAAASGGAAALLARHNPEKYREAWKRARLQYIRRRLRGQWHPEELRERSHGARQWLLRLFARLCVRPNGRTRRLWDSVLLLFVIYNALEVPFVVGLNPPTSRGLAILDNVITALFAADILVNFLTAFGGAGRRSGQLVTDPLLIARNYAGGWLAVDLVATLPFDAIVSAALAARHGGGQNGNDKTLRLLGFLKVSEGRRSTTLPWLEQQCVDGCETVTLAQDC